VGGQPGTFRTQGVGRDREVDFVPFYRLHRRRYGVYWDVFTPREWRQKTEDDAAAKARREKLEAATVAFAQPGRVDHEREINFQGEESSTVRVRGRDGRRSTKWFGFDLPVEPAHPMTLIVTYTNDEQQRRTFDILVEGRKVGEQTIERRSPEKDVRFFDVEYALPADVVAGKRKVNVRFVATDGNATGAVLGLRVVRADALR